MTPLTLLAEASVPAPNLGGVGKRQEQRGELGCSQAPSGSARRADHALPGEEDASYPGDLTGTK